MRSRLGLVLLTAVLPFGLVVSAAANGPCTHCGYRGSCNKVCRLKCEEKKVDVICWGMQCEDFCVGGCSKRCAKHCELVCDECDHDVDPYETTSSGPQKFVWSEWVPKRCPKMYTKSKLMKKIVTKKIPAYQWVVEDLCAQCEAKVKNEEIAPGQPDHPEKAPADPALPAPASRATFLQAPAGLGR